MNRVAHCNHPQPKIVLDLSHDPVREIQLIAVLREMVKAAVARTKALEEVEHGATDRDPGHELKGAEDAPHP